MRLNGVKQLNDKIQMENKRICSQMNIQQVTNGFRGSDSHGNNYVLEISNGIHSIFS